MTHRKHHFTLSEDRSHFICRLEGCGATRQRRRTKRRAQRGTRGRAAR